MPVKIAVEKLRGFVADHQARIVSVDGNRVRLEIDDQPAGRLRRLTDRPVTFGIDVQFEEELVQKDQGQASLGAGTTRTKIKIAIGPCKGRERRRGDSLLQARQILLSFRSYLMAYEDESVPVSGAMTRLKRMLTPWLG